MAVVLLLFLTRVLIGQRCTSGNAGNDTVGCIPLGERPPVRAGIPRSEIHAILDHFRATQINPDRGWKEPRYLESLADLYSSTGSPDVLEVWEARLRANLEAIGKSDHLVKAGMLLTPFAWYLHASDADPNFKANIVSAIRSEFAR